VPQKLLRHRELDGPHTKTEITVTFEEIADGTRITITHAGFGESEGWDEWLEGTTLGWNQGIADLIAYVETGVAARRFTTEMHSPGMTMYQTDAGLRVRSVEPDNLAAQAGLEVGDLLLAVGGVPVFTIAELWVLMREHGAGAKFEIEYVRNGERRRGTGVVHGGWPTEATASA
jgi:predicted metalloprotease with PDZ domain